MRWRTYGNCHITSKLFALTPAVQLSLLGEGRGGQLSSSNYNEYFVVASLEGKFIKYVIYTVVLIDQILDWYTVDRGGKLDFPWNVTFPEQYYL